MTAPYLQPRPRRDPTAPIASRVIDVPANWPTVEQAMLDEEHKRSATAQLLDDVAKFIGRYVAFSADGALDAVTLWVAHTHVVDAFESTPRLALISPVKQSGKTRTLEVVELLVPNPMNVVNTTSAALFRQVAADRPTLLMDEADTYLGPQAAKQHEELRGFVNAGHRRGANAYRCIGEPSKMRVEKFPAFCALAIAGIGDLPDTVIDRAVVIQMKRRARRERIDQFRRRRAAPEGGILRCRLEKWAKRSRRRLTDAEPELPEGITDRPADVWEALIAIADLAGGYWPQRARDACTKLNGARARADVHPGIQLLADVRAVFDTEPAQTTLEGSVPCDRLRSDDLVTKLCAIDDAPWGSLKRGPLNAAGLARRLAAFDIRPTKIRFGDTTAKGYYVGDFADAFERYLPSSLEEEQGEQSEHDEAATTSAVPLVPPVPLLTTQADEAACATCGGPSKADGWCPICEPES
jgi:hypothetical protein